MARTAVTVRDIGRTGVKVDQANEVAGDIVNGNSVSNPDGKVIVYARNAHATLARTVTIRIPRTIDGQAVASRVVSIPALETWLLSDYTTTDYSTTLQLDPETTDIKLIAYRIP